MTGANSALVSRRDHDEGSKGWGPRGASLGVLGLAVQEDVVQDLGDAAADARAVLLWPPVQLVRALFAHPAAAAVTASVAPSPLLHVADAPRTPPCRSRKCAQLACSPVASHTTLQAPQS